MDKHVKVAALYIATLKAMSLIHQHSHWLTNGENFYSDHKLFESLYDSSLENLDKAAEEFIGLFGDDCLNYDLQVDLLNKIMLKYKNLEGSPLEMSLAIERDFLKLSKDTYNFLEEDGQLTLGMDDMLMSIASEREKSVYLLQQTLK